jgi:hypothetical protein
MLPAMGSMAGQLAQFHWSIAPTRWQAQSAPL